MMPSVPQLLIILVIVVLIFGAKRLKNLGGDLGGAVKGFKQAVKDDDAAATDADPARIESERVETGTSAGRERRGAKDRRSERGLTRPAGPTTPLRADRPCSTSGSPSCC